MKHRVYIYIFCFSKMKIYLRQQAILYLLIVNIGRIILRVAV